MPPKQARNAAEAAAAGDVAPPANNFLPSDQPTKESMARFAILKHLVTLKTGDGATRETLDAVVDELSSHVAIHGSPSRSADNRALQRLVDERLVEKKEEKKIHRYVITEAGRHYFRALDQPADPVEAAEQQC